MGLRVCHDLDEQWPLPRQSILQITFQLARILDTNCRASAGLCDLDVIDGREMASRREATELRSLGIPLKAQNAVIEKDDDDRQFGPHHSFRFPPSYARTHHRRREQQRAGSAEQPLPPTPEAAPIPVRQVHEA